MRGKSRLDSGQRAQNKFTHFISLQDRHRHRTRTYTYILCQTGNNQAKLMLDGSQLIKEKTDTICNRHINKDTLLIPAMVAQHHPHHTTHTSTCSAPSSSDTFYICSTKLLTICYFKLLAIFHPRLIRITCKDPARVMRFLRIRFITLSSSHFIFSLLSGLKLYQNGYYSVQCGALAT